MAANDPAIEAARPDTFSAARIGLIAVPIMLALFAAYWFLLRTAYEPILTSVEPDEAAEIVKVLDGKKIDYRLADAGRTILVASDQANKARLELVGSELPVRGQVGFELFNQSDMGLTEFAQKINYQRALQGELARTILLLKGIASVRVHLGLPERSLFRDEQSRPKASVTVILEPGASLTESRVSGIQRMVAGAIPELAPDAVAVLDGTGRVVSSDAAAPPELGGSDAIINDYQNRIVKAIGAALPSLRVGVNVSLRIRQVNSDVDMAKDESDTVKGKAPVDSPSPRGDPDYILKVRVTTSSPLDNSARGEISRIVRETAAIDSGRGDSIVFLVGDPAQYSPEPAAAPALGDRVVTKSAPPPSEQADPLPWSLAVTILVALAAGLAIVLVLRRAKPANRAEESELTSFTRHLRLRLAEEGAP